MRLPALTLPRPAQSTVALAVVAGWMLAGIIITGTAIVRWPPVSSPLLDVVGWELVTIATGVALAVGGALVMIAAHPALKLSTRWRIETSGIWLMGGGWLTYAILSWRSAEAVAVVLIMAGHVAAAMIRWWDIRREERATRALPGAEGCP